MITIKNNDDPHFYWIFFVCFQRNVFFTHRISEEGCNANASLGSSEHPRTADDQNTANIANVDKEYLDLNIFQTLTQLTEDLQHPGSPGSNPPTLHKPHETMHSCNPRAPQWTQENRMFNVILGYTKVQDHLGIHEILSTKGKVSKLGGNL